MEKPKDALKPITINAGNGSTAIAGVPTDLGPQLKKSKLPSELLTLVRRRNDSRNGYETVLLGGLSLGGYEATLRLDFDRDKLEAVQWDIALPYAPLELSVMPEEIAILKRGKMRKLLKPIFGDVKPGKPVAFAWGSVWCDIMMSKSLGRALARVGGTVAARDRRGRGIPTRGDHALSHPAGSSRRRGWFRL